MIIRIDESVIEEYDFDIDSDIVKKAINEGVGKVLEYYRYQIQIKNVSQFYEDAKQESYEVIRQKSGEITRLAKEGENEQGVIYSYCKNVAINCARSILSKKIDKEIQIIKKYFRSE